MKMNKFIHREDCTNNSCNEKCGQACEHEILLKECDICWQKDLSNTLKVTNIVKEAKDEIKHQNSEILRLCKVIAEYQNRNDYLERKLKRIALVCELNETDFCVMCQGIGCKYCMPQRGAE